MQRKKNFLLLFLSLLYLIGFISLERNIDSFHIIHTRVDDAIPFLKGFIIPYLAWFFYIPAVGVYLYHTDLDGFYDFVEMLVLGMFLSLLICLVFPNGTDMRPVVDPEDGFCDKLVYYLHVMDTSTNIFPSVHVYNSLITNHAVQISKIGEKYKRFSFFIAFSICLSTMFLKQHSVVDVIGAVILFYIVEMTHQRFAEEEGPKIRIQKRP